MNLIATTVTTMSSREIAVLVDSTHDSVLKTIRRLIAEGVVSGTETPYTHEQNGQTYSEFMLSFRDTMVVASGYSSEMRAKIIDRWQELEAKHPKFDPASLSRIDILKLAMESEEGRIKAEAERDHAIATKAQIGSRREATAMANVAKANKEVTRLMDRLGFNAKHATVKAVEGATRRSFGPQGWRPLSEWCKSHGISAVSVPDPLYGSVKSWPADAWGEIYDVDLCDLFADKSVA